MKTDKDVIKKNKKQKQLTEHGIFFPLTIPTNTRIVTLGYYNI